VNTIQTTETFDAWFAALRDRKAKARIQARVDRAEAGNFGDCQPMGKGISEMRVHYGAGYRIYFKRLGREWVILLAGGDKSTQQADIKTALLLARELER
jgi:putative addiction module killer protein